MSFRGKFLEGERRRRKKEKYVEAEERMELDQEDWELREEEIGGIGSRFWRRVDWNRMQNAQVDTVPGGMHLSMDGQTETETEPEIEAGIATEVEAENQKGKGKGKYDGSVPNTPHFREYEHLLGRAVRVAVYSSPCT